MAAVTLRLALVGDRDDAKTARQANPRALLAAAPARRRLSQTSGAATCC